MLVGALSEYGQDDLQTVQSTLWELLALREQTMLRRLWHWMRQDEISAALLTARRVTIEAAANLGEATFCLQQLVTTQLRYEGSALDISITTGGMNEQQVLSYSQTSYRGR